MKEFAVFWGCTIPARFPFIEKATRVMFDDLGARIHELEGTPAVPRARWSRLTTPTPLHDSGAQPGPRRERGLDLVTPCNGCYSTFKECQTHLERTGVRHVHQRRLADRGLALQRQASRSCISSSGSPTPWAPASSQGRQEELLGHAHRGALRLPPTASAAGGAVGQIRCNPRSSRISSGALGATVVDYPTKMQCCGGALDRVGERDILARVLPPQAPRPAEPRRRCAHRRLPELLPAVRSEPGGAAACQRERQRSRPLPVRARRTGLRATSRRSSASTCTV